MQANGSTETDLHDLTYRCHFIGISGAVEGLQLFSSPDDAGAALKAMERLRERPGSACVDLWKNRRLIARYSM